MKRRLIYGFLIVILAVNLCVGGKVYFADARAATIKDNPYPSLELFSLVMEKVRKDYVDGKNVTYQELVYGALKGMINTLDPHSEFMEADKFKELQNDTQGAFGGIGVVIEQKDNYVTVVAPIEDTPGFRAGILTGDRITKIDGKGAEKMSSQDAMKYLRGEPGTEVTLTIFRPSSGKTKDYKLKRAVISIDMVKDTNNRKEFPLGENKIGYVRLVQFGEKTGSELDKALGKLKSQGMRALVLDLRGNPGGLLDQAVEVCEKFLSRGQLIVTTEGRNPAQDSRHKAAGRGDMLVNKDGSTMPIVILVNMGSASASEIVAGCLQDTKRAIILGEQTFGKGSVQSILPLPTQNDGTIPALRLTTAKYYTPSHNVIHEHGITPDVLVSMSYEEEAAVQMRRRPGGIAALDEKERVRANNSHDVQLDRAEDLLKGLMIISSRESKSQKMAAK